MNAQLQTDQPLHAPLLAAPKSDAGGFTPNSDARHSELQSPQLAVLPPPAPQPDAAPIQQPPATAQQPARKISRNGKIARLPYLERDMVNRMLRDHIPHPKISGALEEHGYIVTVRNISNWKTRGGFKEWCVETDRALENRILQDNLTEHLRKNDASQLPEVGLQLAATQLSQFLLSPEGQKQLATDPQAYSRTVACLCRIASQIHTWALSTARGAVTTWRADCFARKHDYELSAHLCSLSAAQPAAPGGSG